MTTPYTPNPASNPATIDIPVDGDPGNAPTWVGMQQLADKVANSQANQAKTNVHNTFTAQQTFSVQVDLNGVVHVNNQLIDILGVNAGALSCTPPGVGQRKCLGAWGNGTCFARLYVSNPSGTFVALEYTVNARYEDGAGWHYDDNTLPATYEVLNASQKLWGYYAAAGTDPWTGAAFVANGVNMPVTAFSLGAVLGYDGASGQATWSRSVREGWNTFGTTAGFGYHAGGGMSSHSSGLQPLTCFRDAFGQVHLQGWVDYDGSNGADKGWIATLPAAYRPTKRINVPVFAGPDRTFGSIPTPAQFGILYVDETGAMRIADSTMGASATSYSLDSIAWSVI